MSLASTFDVGFNKSHFAAVQQWKQHAMATYPNEAVGFFLETGDFVPAQNVSPVPKEHFIYDPRHFLDADQLGKVVGIVHSHTHPDPLLPGEKHPQAFPSKVDMEQQLKTALPWGISTCVHESCSNPIWWGDDLPLRPLVGRQFVPGIMDCYSLLRDYHRLLGLELKEVPRGALWWEHGEFLYDDLFEQVGWRKVTSRKEPKEHDVFITDVRSGGVKNHAGVYIGKNMVLQHFQGLQSTRSLASRWAHKMDFLVRHKDL